MNDELKNKGFVIDTNAVFKMRKEPENLLIGVDFSEDDEPTIMVMAHRGTTMKVLNCIQGIDAVIMYEQLTNKKLGGK